ncbi:MAG: PQQ-dependent sugar dehydrogenase [Candidatus Promineifilaceae bacterium]
MNNRNLWRWLLAAIALVVIVGLTYLFMTFRRQVNLAGINASGETTPVQLPPGFQVEIFARDLNGPRFIAFSPDGVLYVADRGNKRIVALPDEDSDGQADSVRVFADDIESPHSLVFHENALFVGVPSGVIRLQDRDGDGISDEREILIDDYPTNGHSTRTVIFLPDGRMAVSVGSSCNVCEEADPRRAAVVIYEGPQATGERIFASGLRNAVGLAIHPETGELWATNNGRDMMGDDLPPETIEIVREGEDYGWPRCHSGRIEDPDLGYPGSCEGVNGPLVEMQAHSAPLGLAFYMEDAFPSEYQDDLFIAFHGSWNRSVPTGYKIVRLPLDDGIPTGPVEDFATGWLDEETGQVSGRPVGLAVGPDGALYASDDAGGFIYRITYDSD